MRRLVEVGISLSSELSLEALLRRLIETAVELPRGWSTPPPRELHDETGQALASILLGLKSLEAQIGRSRWPRSGSSSAARST